MLSPADWRGRPPDRPLGAYRLETDYSWTPADRAQDPDRTRELVDRLLQLGGIQPPAVPPNPRGDPD
jgi:hypothetical protein